MPCTQDFLLHFAEVKALAIEMIFLGAELISRSILNRHAHSPLCATVYCQTSFAPAGLGKPLVLYWAGQDGIHGLLIVKFEVWNSSVVYVASHPRMAGFSMDGRPPHSILPYVSSLISTTDVALPPQRNQW